MTTETRPPVQPIRPAATIIITRDRTVRDRTASAGSDPTRIHAAASGDAAGGIEVFMLRRTSRAAFAAGMYVFPGGRVEGDDHLHAYDPFRTGPTDAQQPQLFAIGHEWRGFWIAAIRETFEEAGLLLAYDGSGNPLEWQDDEHAARFERYRHALHEGRLDLLELCRRERLRLACDRVHFFNRFVTPFGRPRRFDTRFFIAEAPPGQAGLHDDKETTDSLWITPSDALARAQAGEFSLMRVTEIQLEALAEFTDVASLHAWVLGPREFRVVRPTVPREPESR